MRRSHRLEKSCMRISLSPIARPAPPTLTGTCGSMRRSWPPERVWSPASSFTMDGSCTTTTAGRRRWPSLSSFWRKAGDGWKTRSTPAATAPIVIRSWAMTKRRWRPCSARLPMTAPGPRPAAKSGPGFSSGSGTVRPPTGMPWP